MCRVRLPLDAFPFLSNSIELLLSCNKRFTVTPYPWAIRKYRVQRTMGIMSSTATNSLSVELRVFNFCLVELLIGKPLSIVNTPPVWLRILECTANEALTYHVNTPLPSALKIRGQSLSTLRYQLSPVECNSCAKIRSSTLAHIQSLSHKIAKGSCSFFTELHCILIDNK